jgi:hypothetical protein
LISRVFCAALLHGNAFSILVKEHDTLQIKVPHVVGHELNLKLTKCCCPHGQVQWANFDKLELGTGEIRQVLLLTYLNGFQVWDVEEASNVHELVSRRDGPVAFLRLQPKPVVQEPPDGRGGFKEVRPLLLVLTGDTAGSGSPSPGGFSGGHSGGATGSALGVGGSNLVPTVVRFYSLQNHSYVHVLRFRTGIYAVRCSPRVVAVALVAQVHESAHPFLLLRRFRIVFLVNLLFLSHSCPMSPSGSHSGGLFLFAPLSLHACEGDSVFEVKTTLLLDAL